MFQLERRGVESDRLFQGRLGRLLIQSAQIDLTLREKNWYIPESRRTLQEGTVIGTETEKDRER